MSNKIAEIRDNMLASTYFRIGVILFVVLTLCRMFIVDISVIHGESMSPDIHDGDVVVAQKMMLRSLHRNEIVIVEVKQSDGTTGLLCKRVIGLPGERITMYLDGSVRINDKELEPAKYGLPASCDNRVLCDVNIGKGEYFLLGDNREHSLDSRSFGPFKRNKIQSVVKFCIYPFHKIGFQ